MGDVALAAALAWLSALTVYDVRQRRLPNALTLPGAVLVPAAAALGGRGTAALLGGLLLATLYLLVHLVAPAAMGAGDVKLAIGVGALAGAFGPDAWVVAAIGAPLLTALWGLVVLRPGRGRMTVPHGPSMCVATAAAVALVIT
ncbi:prepilin peptidase [Mycolicibacterium sp. P1-18]|uniref:prepilin peptidase n=1 Tax=Mycolicibacterium sp. P1-18 TaxID=2024615 RepID=UPI0011F3828F|nr:A24 family peptidase [Mycolicibacterium sp. P1-18]KAA0101150.1 prepilin peptidase [Mycolicibacterium sp. P1-18]